MAETHGEKVPANSAQPQGPQPGEIPGQSDDQSPALTGPLRPLVDFVAKVNVGVHVKLLIGFGVGAALLLGMGVLSLVVINRMGDRVEELTALQDRVDRGRQMEYAVTAQSHFRAMALLTLDDANNAKIAKAKQGFLGHLDTVEAASRPEKKSFFDRVRKDNDDFTAASEKVLGRYEAGNIDEALKDHIAGEHKISHLLEASMRELIAEAVSDTAAASESFHSSKQFLTVVVWGFSGASLFLAVLLGLVLSWAFIRPVRRIDGVVAQVAGGDFSQRVRVPNRDEFGTLSGHVNRMSEQLGNLYEDLQHELAERQRTAEELQRRAIELVAVNNELESLNYSISHDLWTPLRSIHESSEVLVQEHGERLDDEGKDHVNGVHEASRDMGELLDNIVNMSRVLSLSGGTDVEALHERIDLSSVAQTIAAELREREPEREVEFVIADDLFAEGNPHRLRVALDNLLDNAWKFTRDRAEARIEFGVSERDGELAYFVRDNGVGFDMAAAENLFDPFHRLHSAADFEGVGIGLATVKRIMTSHRGRVWAEGDVDQGATFYFVLGATQSL